MTDVKSVPAKHADSEHASSADHSYTQNIPDTPLTRGHKKKARTRQILLDAAMQIYAELGVTGLTLNDLATKANVSNGTIYNYFKTREEVLSAVGLELADQFSLSISFLSQHIESGSQRLVIGLRMFVLRALREPSWAKALIHVVHFDQGIRSTLANYIRGDLQAGLQEGVLDYEDEDLALSMVVFSTMGRLIGVVEGMHVEGQDIKHAAMVLRALGADTATANRLARLELPPFSA